MDSLGLANKFLEEVGGYPIKTLVSDPRVGFAGAINHAINHDASITNKEGNQIMIEYNEKLPLFYYRGAEKLLADLKGDATRVRLEFLSPFWQFLKKARELHYDTDKCMNLENQMKMLISEKIRD